MTSETGILDQLPGVAYRAEARPDRPLLFVSAGAEKLLGRTADQLLSDSPTTLSSLVHPDERSWLDGRVRRALENGQSLDLRYRVLTPDGEERWVWDRWRVGSAPESDEPVITGLLVDASRLRLLESRAVSDGRRRALGELTGAFAHRFNNLLSAIVGPIELAVATISREEDLHRDLTIARDAAERAANLTSRLQAFSQRQMGRPEVVGINEVVRGLEGMVQELLRPRIRVMVNLEFDAPSVRMDPQHLEQVLVNLVLNSRDAMPEGGRLIISTGTRRLEEADLRRDDDLDPGRYAELRVLDSGEGIPRRLRGRVFEPFFTTRPGRAGLGLSTAYGVVRQAGGIIRLGTSPQGGASVSVLLPVREAVASGGDRERRERPARDHTSPANGLRVLVVEDEEAVLEVVMRALRRQGFTVQGASDRASALAVAEEWEDRVDLAILDVMLGSTTGPRLADALVERMGPVRILFTSAFVDDDKLGRFGVPEGTVFLGKPFSLQGLADAVERALEGGHWEARTTPDEGSTPEAGTG